MYAIRVSLTGLQNNVLSKCMTDITVFNKVNVYKTILFQKVYNIMTLATNSVIMTIIILNVPEI